MKTVYLMATAALLSAAGLYASAEESEKIEPSTCYLSASWGIGQITCVDEKGEPSQLLPASVDVQSSGESAVNELKLTISGAGKVEDAWGAYSLKTEDGEELAVNVSPLETGLVQTRAARGGYRGGAAYRGGAYRGRGYAYRGGAVYRGGRYYRGGAAVVGGAVVGGAAAAAASSYYGGCDPNYQDCGGYYAPGVVGGAVVGGAAAAARRGAYYRGAAYRRGGGAHVSHYRGAAVRGGVRRR